HGADVGGALGGEAQGLDEELVGGGHALLEGHVRVALEEDVHAVREAAVVRAEAGGMRVGHPAGAAASDTAGAAFVLDEVGVEEGRAAAGGAHAAGDFGEELAADEGDGLGAAAGYRVRGVVGEREAVDGAVG